MDGIQEISFAGSCKPVEVKPYVSPTRPRFFCNMDGTTPRQVRPEPRRRRSVFVARRTHPRRRGAGRPKAQSTRSSARSGDSGSDDPAPGWHWAQPAWGYSS